MTPRTSANRVLIVEDDANAGERLCSSFAEMGYSVCKVRNAGDAVAICSHFPPDVAVVDLTQERGTGYALTRYIRERRAESVIILTTAAQEFQPDPARASSAGVDRHFAKSPNLDPLLTFVVNTRKRYQQ